MIKRLIIVWLLCCSAWGLAHSQSMLMLGVGANGLGVPGSGGGGGGACIPGTHATAYLSNFGGSFNATYTAAFCTLINGLDSNNLYGLFDDLKILGNQSAGNAVLPVVSVAATAAGSFTSGATTFSIGSCPTSPAIAGSNAMQIYDATLGQNITTLVRSVFSCVGGTITINSAGLTASSSGAADQLYFYYTPTLNGTPSFAANGGYTGVDSSSTVYIDTGFSLLHTVQCVQDSCNFGIWTNTHNQGTVNGGNCGGAQSGASGTRIYPYWSDGNTYMDINNTTLSDVGAVTTGEGMLDNNRSDSTHTQYYINGSQIASGTQTSVAAYSGNLLILATNSTGSPGFGCNEQVAAYWVASSMTSGQVSTFFSLLDAFALSVGWGYH